VSCAIGVRTEVVEFLWRMSEGRIGLGRQACDVHSGWVQHEGCRERKRVAGKWPWRGEREKKARRRIKLRAGGRRRISALGIEHTTPLQSVRGLQHPRAASPAAPAIPVAVGQSPPISPCTLPHRLPQRTRTTRLWPLRQPQRRCSPTSAVTIVTLSPHLGPPAHAVATHDMTCSI
jgi:hypothetical protein